MEAPPANSLHRIAWLNVINFMDPVAPGETSQRVFVACNDPRRLTPSVGICFPTHDHWGIFYAQPMVLNDLPLFLPRGSDTPENLKGICHASIDPAKAARHWDAIVQLFASVHSGHSSAITVLARYG